MDDRALLEHLIRGPATGDALARAAGQTRAAVWKRIEALRQAGIEIAAQPGRGYALMQPLDLLDAAAIRAALSPPVRKQVSAIEVAWTIDSTNSELLRRRAPQSGGAEILLAERQTGGRGRRGRVWASPLAAHLYLSVARSFGSGLARLGGLSLVAGVAVVEALQSLGFSEARLKWPNDVVVSDHAGLRKLGGLLIEGSGEHAGPARAVMGLGLNVRMPAATATDIDQPWYDLAGLATDASRPLPDRNTIVAALLQQLLPALEDFDAEGLAPFLPRYAALDALAGQAVTLHAGELRQTGTALGVGEDGALRLLLDDGREQRVHAGEVSVRKAGRCMSAWLFDLGNTRLKCAPLLDDRAGEVIALPHREADLVAALADALPPRIDVAYVASVAHESLRVALLQALTARCQRISLARTQPAFAGVRIAYAQPHKLGVDRFLALLAVHARFREPVLLCGVGTALTIDLIDTQGRHVGGRIAPSPTLMREALHERAPQLPEAAVTTAISPPIPKTHWPPAARARRWD